jgi:anti-sigma B factor antagonist
VNAGDLTTSTEVVGDAAVIFVAGDVDLATSGQLRLALAQAIEEGRDVTVDFAELTFIDSSGLSALVDAHRRARGVGGVMTLRNPTPTLLRLLDITRLDTLLAIEPTDSEPTGSDPTESGPTGPSA